MIFSLQRSGGPTTRVLFRPRWWVIIGARETGEFLNQCHEIMRVGVDDFGRMGVDDHRVAVLRLCGGSNDGGGER